MNPPNYYAFKTGWEPCPCLSLKIPTNTPVRSLTFFCTHCLAPTQRLFSTTTSSSSTPLGLRLSIAKIRHFLYNNHSKPLAATNIRCEICGHDVDSSDEATVTPVDPSHEIFQNWRNISTVKELKEQRWWAVYWYPAWTCWGCGETMGCRTGMVSEEDVERCSWCRRKKDGACVDGEGAHVWYQTSRDIPGSVNQYHYFKFKKGEEVEDILRSLREKARERAIAEGKFKGTVKKCVEVLGAGIAEEVGAVCLYRSGI